MTWFLTFLCLATSGVLLTHGLKDMLSVHAASRRFQEQLPTVSGLQMRRRGHDLITRLGQGIAGDEPLGELHGLFLQAGIFQLSAPYIFVALRLVGALAAALLIVVPAGIHHGGIQAKDAAQAFFFGFVVYRGFVILLKLHVEVRQREIRRELPYVLDLVLMVLNSGVSIDQALQHVASQIARVAPVSAVLLQRYIRETEDGVPYERALDRLAQRMAINEGRDFAGLLKQNLMQGGELSQPLQRLAADIGESRLAYAREQLGRKSVLLTVVMLAFFMPVLMVALAGPAVSDVIGTLDHVAHHLQDNRGKR